MKAFFTLLLRSTKMRDGAVDLVDTGFSVPAFAEAPSDSLTSSIPTTKVFSFR
uniref:Uncharacterized protein n=1 Tax=Arundo donax TaxID=35708 RepID=A0A0A9D4G5_ARUDO